MEENSPNLTNVFVASTTISLYNFDFDNLFSYLFRLAKIVLRFMSIALYNGLCVSVNFYVSVNNRDSCYPVVHIVTPYRLQSRKGEQRFLY